MNETVNQEQNTATQPEEPKTFTQEDVDRIVTKRVARYSDYEALKDEPLIDPDTIGLEGSPTNVYKSFSPPAKGACQMLEGNDRGTVDQLTGILADKHLI